MSGIDLKTISSLATYDDPTADELDKWLDTLREPDWLMACRTIVALQAAQTRIKTLENALARLRLWNHKAIRMLQTAKKRILARSAEVVELRAKLRKS